MPFLNYYTPAELAQIRSDGESTYRMRAARGEYKNAIKRGNTWFIPLSDIDKRGRGYDEEIVEPQRLSPEFPNDPQDIVLAKNSEGRYGIYINGDWFGAGQALVILEYLEKHREWLISGAKVNGKSSALARTLEAFLVSDDFKQGVISATIASCDGDHYYIELFPDGTWHLVDGKHLGNKYESPGAMLCLPTLDCDDYQEAVNGDNGMDQDEFFELGLANEEQELKEYLRNALGEALEGQR